jgi:hypothetical protein
MALNYTMSGSLQLLEQGRVWAPRVQEQWPRRPGTMAFFHLGEVTLDTIEAATSALDICSGYQIWQTFSTQGFLGALMSQALKLLMDSNV